MEKTTGGAPSTKLTDVTKRMLAKAKVPSSLPNHTIRLSA